MAYLGGWTWGDVHPLPGGVYFFSAGNNLYRENNGLVGVVDGSWNIIVPYHVQEVCSKVVTFEEKYNNLPRSSCKWPILPGKSMFFKLPEKNPIFLKFAWENRNFSIVPWKNRNLLKICLERSKFFKNVLGKIEIFLKFAWKN